MTAAAHAHTRRGTRTPHVHLARLPLLATAALALVLSPLFLLTLTLVPAPATAYAHPLDTTAQSRHIQPAHDPHTDLHSSPPLSSTPPPPRLDRRPRRKIAIIGSGPSGSSAAYWLHKAQQELEQRGQSPEAGFDVHVYEREEEPPAAAAAATEGDDVAVAGARGRVKAVYPYGDASGRYEPVELGASIFADVNHNLQRIVKDFGLRTGAHVGEDDSTTSVWDGTQFVLDDLGDSWWSSAKLFWRYGYSPVTTRNLVAELKDQFTRLYSPRFLHERTAKNPNVTSSGFPWRTLSDMATALGWHDALAHDAQTWFYAKGVSQLFIQELIEAATRVNYAQNTDTIHALGAGVSMAASGATGVRGGNWQIFQQMLDRSGATLHTGARGEVTGIVKFASLAEAQAAGRAAASDADADADADAPRTLWWVGTAAGTGGLYDAVFVGAPWHASGITLMGTDVVIPTTEYVRLHVTLVATSAPHPNPVYFGRSKGEYVPTEILTSYAAMRRQAAERKPQIKNASPGFSALSLGGIAALWHAAAQWLCALFTVTATQTAKPMPKLEFNSLTYLARLPPRLLTSPVQEEHHLVKIFSLAPLSDDKIAEMLDPEYAPSANVNVNVSSESIHWVHRAEWDAYPYLRPKSGAEGQSQREVQNQSQSSAAWAPLQPAPALFYINALEPLVSTMETSTVSARNAVALLLQEWYGLGFVVGQEGECEWKRQGAWEGEGEGEGEGDGRKGWDGWGCYAA